MPDDILGADASLGLPAMEVPEPSQTGEIVSTEAAEAGDSQGQSAEPPTAPEPSSPTEEAPPAWFAKWLQAQEAEKHRGRELAQVDNQTRAMQGRLDALKAKVNSPDATMDDLLAYIDARRDADKVELQGATRQTAEQAHSEQLIRGQVADYDDVIEKFVAPDLANPDIRSFFDKQDNPALARYVYGVMVEAMRTRGGDITAWAKAVRAPVTTQAEQAKRTVASLEQAARAGAKEILGPGPSAAAAKLTAADIKNMTDEDFAKTFGVSLH